MSDKTFLNNYFETLKKLIDPEKYISDLERVKNILKETHQIGKKIMIFCNSCYMNIVSLND